MALSCQHGNGRFHVPDLTAEKKRRIARPRAASNLGANPCDPVANFDVRGYFGCNQTGTATFTKMITSV